MKSILTLLAFAFPAMAICADDFKFAIVAGVETFQRVRSAPNLYPWDHAGPDEIVVSNACGFARVQYYRVTTPRFSNVHDERNLKPWKAFVLLGEWCKISEFILDDLTLVAYREWKGKIYLLDHAELFVDNDGRLYVEDSQFIAQTGLDRFSRSDYDADGFAGCRRPDVHCAEMKIYVDAIPMQANSSLERTRER